MLVGLFTGIAGGFFFYRNRYKQLQKKSRLTMIDSFHKDVRLTLLDAVRTTDACNAVLLHMHNGGPAMAAGMRQYSSVVEEAPREAAFSALIDWQSVFVDREYREMISELQEKNALRILTAEMEDGLLKRRYEAMGVTATDIFWCYETPGGPYYISFPTNSKNPLEYIGGPDFAKIEGINNRIRNTLRKYEKMGVLH